MWALQAFRSPNEMKKIRTRERKDYLIGHHDKWTQATNESVSFKTTGVTLFKYNYWTRVNKSTQHPLTALWANNWCEVWEAVHSGKSRDVTRQLSLHLLIVWPISGVIRLWSHLTGNSEQHHVMNTPGGILSSNKCCLEIYMISKPVFQFILVNILFYSEGIIHPWKADIDLVMIL